MERFTGTLSPPERFDEGILVSEPAIGYGKEAPRECCLLVPQKQDFIHQLVASATLTARKVLSLSGVFTNFHAPRVSGIPPMIISMVVKVGM